MKRFSALQSVLHAFLIGTFILLSSCASNDKSGAEENGFATLGEEGAASDLELLEDDVQDLEAADSGSNAEMMELESEFADMGVEPEGDGETGGGDFETAQNDAPLFEEEPITEGADNSGDSELDALLDGGGEATPETYAEPTDWNASPDAGASAGPRTAVISNTPQIPNEAFEKGGALLNRFYFARKGDTWESISQALYGNSDRSVSLQTWNGRRLKPGKLVYYESPSNRSDSNMISYFEERGIAPTPYTMQKGEWLSLLAQQQYGDGRSWKEIAALNGISSPDSVKVGTQLMLYPASTNSGYQETVANNSVPEPEPEPQPAPPITADEPTAPEDDFGFNNAPQPAAPPPVVQAPPAYAPPPPPVTQAQGRRKFSTSRMLQQNMFALAIAGIVVVLLLALYVLNKRKKATALRQDDLMDDNFAPPRAGRR